jgi:hypothetical protein
MRSSVATGLKYESPGRVARGSKACCGCGVSGCPERAKRGRYMQATMTMRKALWEALSYLASLDFARRRLEFSGGACAFRGTASATGAMR